MSREQVWCTAGHYFDLEVPVFHSLSGVTAKGARCLVRGCDAKILVRNFVEGSHQVGFIPPTFTGHRNELQAQELLNQAKALRAEAALLMTKADQMEATAPTLKLYKIPDLERDQTEIDPEKYLEWHRSGDSENPPRIPRRKQEALS